MKTRLIGGAKRLIVLTSDVALTVLAYWFAYYLRFNFDIPKTNFAMFLNTLPVLVVLRVACFFIFGLYSGVWRYASMDDLIRIVKATVLSSLIFSVYGGFVHHLSISPGLSS